MPTVTLPSPLTPRQFTLDITDNLDGTYAYSLFLTGAAGCWHRQGCWQGLHGGVLAREPGVVSA